MSIELDKDPDKGVLEAASLKLRKPRLTFRQLQAINRKRAFFLALALLTVLGLIGAIIGMAYGNWIIGLVIGLGFAGVQYLVARKAGSAMIMRTVRARPIERSDDSQLINVVQEIAIAAGIPCPTVYLIDDPVPNALATGFKPEDSAVAITTGLREKLNRDELQAVIAHEIGHIRNGDTGYMVLMAVIVGSILLLCDAFLHGSMRGMAYGARSSRGRGKAGVPLFILALLLAIIAPIFSKLLQAAVSRQREYLADATSVELMRHPEALISALTRLSEAQGGLQAANRGTQHLFIINPMRRASGGGGKFASHPPLKERIKRIKRLIVQD